MLVNKGDDGSDVLLFYNVQSFRAVHQHTVKYIQYT